jgi:hypothetical protein
MLSLLLAILTVHIEYEDEAFAERQFFPPEPQWQTVSFLLCTFRNCTAGGQMVITGVGGGLAVFHQNMTLSVIGCAFGGCRALLGGGAFGAMCMFFSMSGTTGSECSGGSEPFGIIARHDIALVSQSSAVTCRGAEATLGINHEGNAGITRVESFNASLNTASFFGSGLAIYESWDLALTFSAFVGNGPVNCLRLSVNALNSSVSCLRITNNSCHGGYDYFGFVYAVKPVVIEKSVFQYNDIDYFAGGGGSITLIECSVDSTINVTDAIPVATQNCIFGTHPLTWAAGCTASPSGSGSPADTGLSGGTIAAIVIGTIIGVALLVGAGIAVRTFIIKPAADVKDTTARPLDLTEKSPAAGAKSRGDELSDL